MFDFTKIVVSSFLKLKTVEVEDASLKMLGREAVRQTLRFSRAQCEYMVILPPAALVDLKSRLANEKVKKALCSLVKDQYLLLRRDQDGRQYFCCVLNPLQVGSDPLLKICKVYPNGDYKTDATKLVEADTKARGETGNSLGPDDFESRIRQFKAEESKFSFDRLIVNADVMEALMMGLSIYEHFDLIYNEWGLKQNNPCPHVALNFFGKSGTGKTLAAQAMAHELHKKIIITSYSKLVSAYHGESSKNVEAAFSAAERQDAVLFIDEADVLLSRRLSDVKQGADQAVNALSSQFLTCLNNFKGLVIFATNLVENYDPAFESRLRSIEFKMPDEDARQRIWALHLPAQFPVAANVDPKILAKIDDVSGRDIANAVQRVAEKMAYKGISQGTLEMFEEAVKAIKETRFKKDSVGKTKSISLSDSESKLVSKAYRKVAEENPSLSQTAVDNGKSEQEV